MIYTEVIEVPSVLIFLTIPLHISFSFPNLLWGDKFLNSKLGQTGYTELTLKAGLWQVRKVMPEDTVYFTIVREPLALFQSLFAFARIEVLLFIVCRFDYLYTDICYYYSLLDFTTYILIDICLKTKSLTHPSGEESLPSPFIHCNDRS